jgi:hypothetical protein
MTWKVDLGYALLVNLGVTSDLRLVWVRIQSCKIQGAVKWCWLLTSMLLPVLSACSNAHKLCSLYAIMMQERTIIVFHGDLSLDQVISSSLRFIGHYHQKQRPSRAQQRRENDSHQRPRYDWVYMFTAYICISKDNWGWVCVRLAAQDVFNSWARIEYSRMSPGGRRVRVPRNFTNASIVVFFLFSSIATCFSAITSRGWEWIPSHMLHPSRLVIADVALYIWKNAVNCYPYVPFWFLFSPKIIYKRE